jgi:DNA-binding MarR family transcriptional regulator
VWRALVVTLYHLEAALDRQLQRDAGIPHAHYGILVALADAEGGALRMGELAATLEYSKSRLAHAVAAMERRGWVRRVACPHDRRGQIAELTGLGRDALERAAPGHVAEVRRLVFDVLAPDEQQALGTALARIAEHLAAQPSSARPG